MTERETRTQWFTEARFGMFIHWGLYAIPGRGEWYMSEAKIPAGQYERYMQEFSAKAYDPRDWARRAKRAGMQYVVLTAQLKTAQQHGKIGTEVSVWKTVNLKRCLPSHRSG